MKIPSVNITQKRIKPQWQTMSKDDCRKIFEDFPLHNDVLGNLTIGLRKYEDGFNNWIIEIKNAMNKVFGQEVITMYKDTKEIMGIDIFVEKEYRQKKYKFGELMRLFSIMEMKENKCNSLKIYSKDSAIYFHGKYKFKPNIGSINERREALETIIEDKSENVRDLAAKAKEIYDKTLNKPSNQDELYAKTNELVNQYIERILQEGNHGQKHPFKRGMLMKLDFDTVLENKEFFNSLFKKHGIDYTI